ncbi:MAG: GNAT family N-acetyltransferase [Cellulosilyticaceae bacterium]
MFVDLHIHTYYSDGTMSVDEVVAKAKEKNVKIKEYQNNDDEICELRKMYLYKIFQGQGIGKTLMENALEEAKRLQYKMMTLQTSSKLIKALPLYKKLGFVKDCSGEVCSRCNIEMKKELV